MRFVDESRLIASEYQGGLEKYGPIESPPRETEPEPAALRPHMSMEPLSMPAASMPAETNTPMAMANYAPPTGVPPMDRRFSEIQLPVAGSRRGSVASVQMPSTRATPHGSMDMGANSGGFSLAALQDKRSVTDESGPPRAHKYKVSDVSSVASSLVPQGHGPPSGGSVSGGQDNNQHKQPDGLITPPSENAATGERDYLNSPEEVRYMQVFIEEVGVWMDSFDKDKHFSRVIPYVGLKSPMLLNAFLACGAKQLTLVDPTENQHDHRALCYYDTATTQLLRSLSNPDRNMGECATTAVVLNVYEIMSDKPAKRMNHIAGARALIRECGWNAKSRGIGSACFWLNIGMEVLSCLSFNWQTAWHPDDWGLDMTFFNDIEENGGSGAADPDESGGIGRPEDDQEWVHRIFYIVAKIASFRANIPRFQEPSPYDEQVRLQSRFSEWKRLKALCDAWCNSCPRSMRPFGYLPPSQTQTKSAFPNVW